MTLSISNGTLTRESEEGMELLYQVTIELQETELHTAKEAIKAIASMPITANIVYEKERYFEWILEQLNIWREE